MSQYSNPKSNRMEPAVLYEEEDLDGRDALRKGIWYQALDNVQYQRGESLPSEEQRLQKQVALRMPFLGEQPLEEWVKELEHRVWQELWLEDAYQALWWYMAQYIPWTAEHDKPEGEEFDGPGLLWESFAEPDFGSPAQSRLQDIFYEREARHEWDDPHEVEQDLAHLATLEWELEQDYRDLFHSIGKAQQDSKKSDPGPEPFSWEDIVDVYWEEPQVAGGDGTEVSPPVLQGIGSLVSIPQRQCEVQGGESSGLPPQRQAELQGAEVVVPAPQQQHDFGGIGSLVSIPQWQAELQGAETVGPVPQQQHDWLGAGSLVSIPQRQLNAPGGDSKPHNCADGTVVSALTAQGVGTVGPVPQQQGCLAKEETVGLPLKQPDVQPSPQGYQEEEVSVPSPSQLLPNRVLGAGDEPAIPTDPFPAEELASGQRAASLCSTDPLVTGLACTPLTPAEELASGQSAVGLCPPSTYSSKLENYKERSSRCPLNSWGPTEQSQALRFNRSSIGLWVGCQTNSGTDRREVRYLVSLPWGGKMCGETNLATGFWRGLFKSLLPQDYGP